MVISIGHCTAFVTSCRIAVSNTRVTLRKYLLFFLSWILNSVISSAIYAQLEQTTTDVVLRIVLAKRAFIEKRQLLKNESLTSTKINSLLKSCKLHNSYTKAISSGGNRYGDEEWPRLAGQKEIMEEV